MLKRVNIRVYGLLLHCHRILLIDEQVRDRKLTKFPGGGMELGEGPIDCLIREFNEEIGTEIRVREHVYTTGFFQLSAFSPEDQIISIYYRVEAPTLPADTLPDIGCPPVLTQQTSTIVRFRWKPLTDLSPDDVTLPIDRHVVEHCLPERLTSHPMAAQNRSDQLRGNRLDGS